MVVGGVPGPVTEPRPDCCDLLVGQPVVSEGPVRQPVQLAHRGGDVLGAQARVAPEAQPQQGAPVVAVERRGGVEVVAWQRPAQQGGDLVADGVLQVQDRADVQPDGSVLTPVTAQVDVDDLLAPSDLQAQELPTVRLGGLSDDDLEPGIDQRGLQDGADTARPPSAVVNGSRSWVGRSMTPCATSAPALASAKPGCSAATSATRATSAWNGSRPCLLLWLGLSLTLPAGWPSRRRPRRRRRCRQPRRP